MSSMVFGSYRRMNNASASSANMIERPHKLQFKFTFI